MRPATLQNVAPPARRSDFGVAPFFCSTALFVKPSSQPIRNAKLVESFRGEVRATAPLHPQELALVVIASLHLCFLPWALGTRDVWSQLVSLGLGFLSFAVGLWPRHYRGELAPHGAFILHPWSRLIKFPVFWLGLLLIAYIACQGLNPAFARASAGPYWWIAPVPHIEWLPSGIDATFAQMNAWRMLTVLGAAWLLACALWAGVSRRASAHALMTVLVVNGTLLALLGILQKITAAKGVFWVITAVPDYFVATFYYKNHAGAYFSLMTVTALSLMAWYHLRALRRIERSSPAPVYAFAATVLASIVFLSISRTATILLAGHGVLTLGVLLFHKLKSRDDVSPALATFSLLSAIIVIIASASFLNLDKSVEQIQYAITEEGQQAHLKPRELAREASWDLFQQDKLTGWGAGAFRHAFPLVQRNYEAIYRASWDKRIALGWDHAHNDYLECLVELGWLGSALPALILLWLLYRGFRAAGIQNPAHLILFLGLLLPLAHSWLDFPMYNPAFFITFCALWILLIRWTELESTR